VRVDTGVQSGSTVPGTFDSLMAKLIITGATRAQAIARARRALKEFRIEGVPSVLPFHRAVMAHADFTSADAFSVHTRWIETDFADTLAAAVRPEPLADIALVRTAVEIDGRRIALGLPAELLRGLHSTAPSAEREGADVSSISTDAAAVVAPISGTLQSWNVRRRRQRGCGRHPRFHGGDEDGNASHGTPRRTHHPNGVRGFDRRRRHCNRKNCELMRVDSLAQGSAQDD